MTTYPDVTTNEPTTGLETDPDWSQLLANLLCQDRQTGIRTAAEEQLAQEEGPRDFSTSQRSGHFVRCHRGEHPQLIQGFPVEK